MASPGAGGADQNLVRTTVDPDEPVWLAVLRAIAAVEDERIEELPQLYRSIDPDALRELVEDDRFQGRIAFTYCEYRVVIEGDRSITVRDGDPTP